MNSFKPTSAVKILTIYELHDELGVGFLKACRNGRHLSNCSAATCPHHFKCAIYYCVPVRYTCDGKRDCPLGDDENICHKRQCPGLFRCRNSSICLHYYDVLDGRTHCLQGDDELFDDLSDCPMKCDCLMTAITCTNISTILWQGKKAFLYILLSQSTLQTYILQMFPKATILRLPMNQLKLFCTSHQRPLLSSVKYLDISSNGIAHLTQYCFKTALILLELNMSSNVIQFFRPRVFDRLKSLLFLDLSNNTIKMIPSALFCQMKKLTVLNIMQETLFDFSPDSFESDSLKLIMTSDFHICCNKNKKMCTSQVRWPFTCGSLLESGAIVWIVWFFACTILSANSIAFIVGVILLRKSDEATGYEMIIITLHIADYGTGLHLFGLAVANAYYGNSYTVHDVNWRHSFPCHSLSIIALITSLMAIFILGFVALSRLFVIKYPLTTSIKEPGVVKKLLSFGFLFIQWRIQEKP